MICPHCQFENGDGARFCTRCGGPLPSPRRRAFLAFMKGLLYYGVFHIVQATVLIAYALFTILPQMLTSGLFLEDEAVFMEEYLSLFIENMHPLMILSALLTVLLLCLSFRIRRKNPITEMHLFPASPLYGGLSVLFGIALQAVVVITISLLPLSPELLAEMEANSALLEGGNPIVQFLNVAIVTPFLEEMIFRGLVFTRMSQGMKTGAAVALSALVFGWAHGSIISFLYAALLGVLFALLMRRHGNSILTPFLCHAGFNGASFLMTLVPDNTLIILIIYFIAIAAALLLGYLLFRKPSRADGSGKESYETV